MSFQNEEAYVNRRRLKKNFENAKNQVLGWKRDKSSAGRIDPKAVDICAIINKLEAYYTTSSCAGRCFLYRGRGVKSTNTFVRYRVSHDKIHDPNRYFDLSTLRDDPTGGGDPIPTIGQYEHSERLKEEEEERKQTAFQGEDNGDNSYSQPRHNNETNDDHDTTTNTATTIESNNNHHNNHNNIIWLRYEPFILHVACRSLNAASALMNAARPSFKNVGLTTWKNNKYLVAVWGDEGLDMPLMSPSLSTDGDNGNNLTSVFGCEYLASLVNERHERNWNKIDRFVQAVREMSSISDDDDDDDDENDDEHEFTLEQDQQQQDAQKSKVPRSYDVIGDVAVLHSINTDEPSERREIGETIMRKNKAIKVVAVRQSNLTGTERAPGESGYSIIAGSTRDPLMSTHIEFGIKCVVNLNHTFFTPRMARERLRICQQVARGEQVLVLFAGVAMDALQIAGRTEASTVMAIELNPTAVACARRAHQILERNKAVKCPGAANRLQIVQGDVLQILPTLEENYYDRVVAPRPKEGSLDGDLGGDSKSNGRAFLDVLLTVIKKDGGECHWYDFVADHEYPDCIRTRNFLEKVCERHSLKVDILHVAQVGSVAMRQLRVCVDFKVSPLLL